MSDAPQLPIKPAQGFSLLVALGALILAYKFIYANIPQFPDDQSTDWIGAHIVFVSISHYAPHALDDFHQYHSVQKLLNYAPVPIVAMIITLWLLNSTLEILFKKPQYSLLEDPEFDSLHKGVISPKMNHLEAILSVLPPEDRSVLVFDIALGVIDPVTPESVVSDIVDRPLSIDSDAHTAVQPIAYRNDKR